MKTKVLEQKSQDYWCDYNATNITPPILWRRMNNGGHRFYYAEDNDEIIIGAGITTVIAKAFPESIFLRDWKDRTPNHKELLNTMANYGTLCHIGFQSLLTDKKLDSSLIEIADEVFGMREKFKRDMVSLAFFIEKHNVKPLFIEGILAKKVINKNGYVDYICTAIDLFCEMDIEEKNEVQDGYYKSGERKGEPKFVKEVTTKRVFAILDLKSNYDDKEEKSFFDSHFMQLLHGASCIEEQFGIKPLMFNLSTKKWTKEPAYFLKHWVDKPNKRGYTTEELMNKAFESAILSGIIEPSGSVLEIDNIGVGTTSLKTLSYHDMAFERLTYLKMQS